MVARANKSFLFTYVILIALCLVSITILLKQQWHGSLFELFSPTSDLSLDGLLIQNNTLPRLAMALLAGGALGLCTVVLQQITHNPLAADSTLAVSSGAQLSLLIASIFFPQWLIWNSDIWALLGAGLSLGAVLLLSVKGGFIPLRMILAGLIVSLYLGAISSMLVIFFSEEAAGVLLWGSGSLVQDSWHDSLGLLWRVILCIVALLIIIRPLQIMSLSDTQAQSLGIPVGLVRFLGLLIAAYLSASVVSMVGMLGFIGLAAASITRQLGARRLGHQLLFSFFMGGLLLLLTDSLLQILQHQTQLFLPTGSVTALIGAPLLLWLVFRMPPQHQVAVETLSAYRVLKPQRTILFVLFLGLIGSICLSLFVSKGVSGWNWTGFNSELIDLRYPRLLAAAAAGLMLATAGVLLQRLTQNPMASPELLGISSGTSIGVLVAVFFSVSSVVLLWSIGVFSAAITLSFLVLVNRRNGMSPEKVLLTGITVAALFDALIRLFLASGNPKIQTVLVWLSGSTYQATPAISLSLIIIALLFFCLCLPLHRWLSLLSLNSTVAQAVGLNVAWVRGVLIFICSVLTALATLMMGPLSFVGLLAPHLAKLIGFQKPFSQLFVAGILGMWVMILSDWLGRYLVFPYEIPAGLVAMILGGGYFLFMMRKL